MSAIGRNSSLFKDALPVPMPVRISDAPADLVATHREHKKRLASIRNAGKGIVDDEAIPRKYTMAEDWEGIAVKETGKKRKRTTVEECDIYLEAIKKAASIPLPKCAEDDDGIPLPPPRPTLSKIMREVALKHDLLVIDIMGDSRRGDIVLARHEYCWRARQETDRSFPQIARYCGNRDHTCALNSYRRFEALILEGKVIWPEPKPEQEGQEG